MRSETKISRGLTLVEAVVLMVIISIVGVATAVGLQSVIKVPARTDEIMAMNSVAVASMEQVKASLSRNWPSGTFSDPILLNATSYPASMSIGASPWTSAGYTTPTSGNSPAPIAINGKTYVMNVTIDQADPACATSYKTDYLQVSITVTPLIGGVQATDLRRRLVTYVAQQ